jgi:hypothetical protein
VLPPLDAVVGNPPYVRQEKIDKKDKEEYGQIASQAWPDLRMSGRSDLHCYFWPAATRLLKEDGYFGFLTSSSWLDVEYGFALQGWILRHFRILAIMESAAEPWFEDARVKTCVTILKRCEDAGQRMANRVRFVRFGRPLSDIIGIAPGLDEEARQAAYERLQKLILEAEQDYQDQDVRIIIKTQMDLWNDGVNAAKILGGSGDIEFSNDVDEEESFKEEFGKSGKNAGSHMPVEFPGSYRAGKWGRYLRASDFYFEIMRRFGPRFVPLGEVAMIRRGITSGCDAFFMPKDVSQEMLRKHQSESAFRQAAGGAPKRDVESGKLKIIEAGDGSIHPIEAKYLAPELHSPMEIDRPVVRAADLDRVVLLVGEPMAKLKHDSPWAWRYLNYGTQQTFASAKSKAVPVPKRSTVESRDTWYDLTGLVCPGIAFWPKSQQYRHIIPLNRENIICNCNLYDIAANKITKNERLALIAILNSTLVGLFKTFYGRFAGTEGNLKTEVVDVNLMEVPDPRGISVQLAKRLAKSLGQISRREVGRLVEEQLMDCHEPDRARRIAAGPLALSEELGQADRRALDDAVFELLGVSNPQERTSLINRLYETTARHFREIRVVEIEKMEQRAKSDRPRLSVNDLASDIWDAAELEDLEPLKEWLSRQPESEIEINIPEERPAFLPDNPLFELKTISYGKKGKIKREYGSRPQAVLVFLLANLGLSGNVRLAKEKGSCQELLARIEDRLARARSRFKDLAQSRTGDERIRVQVLEVLERWFILGRK